MAPTMATAVETAALGALLIGSGSPRVAAQIVVMSWNAVKLKASRRKIRPPSAAVISYSSIVGIRFLKALTCCRAKNPPPVPRVRPASGGARHQHASAPLSGGAGRGLRFQARTGTQTSPPRPRHKQQIDNPSFTPLGSLACPISLHV